MWDKRWVYPVDVPATCSGRRWMYVPAACIAHGVDIPGACRAHRRICLEYVVLTCGCTCNMQWSYLGVRAWSMPCSQVDVHAACIAIGWMYLEHALLICGCAMHCSRVDVPATCSAHRQMYQEHAVLSMWMCPEDALLTGGCTQWGMQCYTWMCLEDAMVTGGYMILGACRDHM
jgi:hypothetical protein